MGAEERNLDTLPFLKRRLRELQAKQAEEARQREETLYGAIISRRKAAQARRNATRCMNRYEIFLRYLALRELFDALMLNDLYRCCGVDELRWMECHWRSDELPKELFEKRLAEYQAAGGSRELQRLHRMLEALSYRPEPLIKQLCRGLFGDRWDREENEGKEVIWEG